MVSGSAAGALMNRAVEAAAAAERLTAVRDGTTKAQDIIVLLKAIPAKAERRAERETRIAD